MKRKVLMAISGAALLLALDMSCLLADTLSDALKTPKHPPNEGDFGAIASQAIEASQEHERLLVNLLADDELMKNGRIFNWACRLVGQFRFPACAPSLVKRLGVQGEPQDDGALVAEDSWPAETALLKIGLPGVQAVLDAQSKGELRDPDAIKQGKEVVRKVLGKEMGTAFIDQWIARADNEDAKKRLHQLAELLNQD